MARNELKNQIIKILTDFPQSRDSDQWLTIKLWCIFYPSRIIREEGKEPTIRLKDVMDMPREDNVKRIRAIIQNEEHRFLPTSLEVAKQRKINEEEWRAYVQNQQKLL